MEIHMTEITSYLAKVFIEVSLRYKIEPMINEKTIIEITYPKDHTKLKVIVSPVIF